jgi:hypothetical protein
MTENIQPKSNGRGGARPGAGRKPGTANVKTREIADRAAKEGITPLDVMIKAMRETYEASGAAAAFQFARDVAPYMHPRISSVEVSGKDGGAIQQAHIVGSVAEFRQIAQRIIDDV